MRNGCGSHYRAEEGFQGEYFLSFCQDSISPLSPRWPGTHYIVKTKKWKLKAYCGEWGGQKYLKLGFSCSCFHSRDPQSQFQGFGSEEEIFSIGLTNTLLSTNSKEWPANTSTLSPHFWPCLPNQRLANDAPLQKLPCFKGGASRYFVLGLLERKLFSNNGIFLQTLP